MKKIKKLLVASALVFTLFGCGSQPTIITLPKKTKSNVSQNITNIVAQKNTTKKNNSSNNTSKVTNEPTTTNASVYYTVKFDTNGAPSIGDVLVKEYGKITKPEDPVLSGCEFLGWYCGESLWNFENYVVKEDITLVAHFKEKSTKPKSTYQISVSYNSEQGFVIGSGLYYEGDHVYLIATPKEGFEFEGWYLDDVDNTLYCPVTKCGFYVESDLKIIARFKRTEVDSVDYKVEHYLENIDGTYNLIPDETDTLSGIPGDATCAEENAYDYFNALTFEQETIDENGNTVVKIYYERETFNLTVTSANSSYGTTTTYSSEPFKYGSTITLSATPKTNYSFSGWYTSDTLLSLDSSYTFTMSGSDLSLEGRFQEQSYTITLDTTGCNNLSVKKYTVNYDERITLPVPTKNNDVYTNYQVKYKFVGWYNGSKAVTDASGYSIKYNYTTDITLTAKFEIESILMGYYPQTRVSDSISDIQNAKSTWGSLPNGTNSYNWTAYDYYCYYSVSEYMYYIDLDVNNDGINDYRGIYLTKYRGKSTGISTLSADNSYQYDNGYRLSTVYWFKYELIEWTILNTDSNGNSLLISNLILDAQQYYVKNSTRTNGTAVTYTGLKADSGATIYCNNYEYSDIRGFLNKTFYNTAFTSSQKNIIVKSRVDNSWNESGYESDSIFYGGFLDERVYLLSHREIKAYYSNIRDSAAVVSEYAKAQGLEVANNGCSTWLLRTPNPKKSDGRSQLCIAPQGYVDNTQTDYVYEGGLRPVMYVKL